MRLFSPKISRQVSQTAGSWLLFPSLLECLLPPFRIETQRLHPFHLHSLFNITDVFVTSHAIILFARSADSLNSCHHKLLDLYLLIPIRVLNRRISPYNWISETPLDVPLLSNDLLQLLKYFDNSRHNLSQTGHQCHLVLHLIDQWPVISLLDCFAHALPHAHPWKPWCCGDLGECPNDGLKVILHSL